MSYSDVSPSSSYHRNARSQPIAIKDAHLYTLESLNEEREECEKQFYECATWRMYSRIVADRLNTPPRYSTVPVYNGCPSPASVGSHVQQGHNSGSPVPTSGGLIRPQPRYARPSTVSPFEHSQSQLFCPNPFMDAAMMHSMQSDSDDEVFELEL
jgi:hypothetical protein